MLKKCFKILLVISLFITPAFAENYTNNYVGTPPGFYDDIDPNTLDEDEDIVPWNNSNQHSQNSQMYHEFNDEDIILSPNGNKTDVSIDNTQTKASKNYSQIYNNLEPAKFSYLHDIDPDQYYDLKDAAWSVYPLLRLNSPIYFKSITVEPGYYLLTPREHDGKWYMLFKQNGVVKHIIPVYDRDYTPETFYDQHIPKPKLTRAQKVHMGFLDFLGNFNSSKRKEPIKSYLEVNDLENHFISIVVYYGGHKYSTIYRTIRL